jgi:hypothetical protein
MDRQDRANIVARRVGIAQRTLDASTRSRYKGHGSTLRSVMNDFAFVAIILAFFVVAVLFVKACDRIIGPDDEAFAGAPSATVEDEPVAA